MIKKLIDIVTEIKVGYTFRESLLNNPDGNLAVIQLRDVDSSLLYLNNFNTIIDNKSINNKHFLKKGDMIFAAKGSNNFASIFKADISAVASSVFFIIRIKRQIVSPEYVAWYINNKLGQAYLNSIKYSTTTTNIKKKDLENLPIYIPEIETQMRIGALAELSQRETTILEEIKSKRKVINEQKIINLINTI